MNTTPDTTPPCSPSISCASPDPWAEYESDSDDGSVVVPASRNPEDVVRVESDSDSGSDDESGSGSWAAAAAAAAAAAPAAAPALTPAELELIELRQQLADKNKQIAELEANKKARQPRAKLSQAERAAKNAERAAKKAARGKYMGEFIGRLVKIRGLEKGRIGSVLPAGSPCFRTGTQSLGRPVRAWGKREADLLNKRSKQVLTLLARLQLATDWSLANKGLSAAATMPQLPEGQKVQFPWAARLMGALNPKYVVSDKHMAELAQLHVAKEPADDEDGDEEETKVAKVNFLAKVPGARAARLAAKASDDMDADEE